MTTLRIFAVAVSTWAFLVTGYAIFCIERARTAEVAASAPGDFSFYQVLDTAQVKRCVALTSSTGITPHAIHSCVTQGVLP